MLDDAILESHLSGLSFADPQGLLVLADWLQSRQDPWGELIVLQHAVASNPTLEPAVAALLAQHARAWAGMADCEWQLGFVRTATLRPIEPTLPSMISAVAEFFARPAARLCDGVVFAPAPTEFRTTRDWSSSTDNVIRPYRQLDALMQAVPQRVNRIGFGAWPPTPAMAYVEMPDFRELSRCLQRLTELTLIGNDRDVASALLLPNCTKLAVRCADLKQATIQSLLVSRLPVLEHLTVSFGGSSHVTLDDIYPADNFQNTDDGPHYPPTYTAQDLAALSSGDVDSKPNSIELFAATNLPSLRHLSLASSSLHETANAPPRALAEIARGPLIQQLTSLDLSDCSIGDRDVDLLIGLRENLAHLSSLDLRRNRLTHKSVVRLASAFPAAKLDCQELYRSPTFYMRYVGTME